MAALSHVAIQTKSETPRREHVFHPTQIIPAEKRENAMFHSEGQSSRILVATVGALIMLAGPALAETIAIKVPLSGASEVPATTSKGSGSADVTFDTASKKLSWKLTYSDLTGPATMAHFHGPATASQNASPVVPIPNIASGVEGSATLTDAQAADLMAGKYYVNVHTAANPAGEIRGQVIK